ncbi:SpoIIIAH-like family protein [Thermosediminibacter litoriperuensis]|uniref:Stage III sporulation protein AH n=1 Tax=Thermosediminibacter litoriperuensis TaxID=291989 RepID=A0A5S5AL80_9FIRM|nr:SpoIIIAH-like family protein [Thermosediminibacter litoriperuensis]TYP51635.1 stage III sporulation protein AH [Thermosediminibacter litoriperuensis]
MFLFKRKTVLIIMFIGLLVFSIYLMLIGNYPRVIYKNSSAPDAEKVTALKTSEGDTANVKNGSEKDFFIDYRLERDRLRSQEADYLREIINNPNASQESKEKAQKDLIALAEKVEKEMMVENLIKAKGFEEAVIIISGDSANVIVKSNGLSQKEVAQITDVVTRTTGYPMDKITIVERK